MVSKNKTAHRACSALLLFAFYGKLCYSMYVVASFWHQKGGDFDGIHNYHFSGGHGTSDWSLRVQVVRPPASRQLAHTAPNVNCNLLEFCFRFKYKTPKIALRCFLCCEQLEHNHPFG